MGEPLPHWDHRTPDLHPSSWVTLSPSHHTVSLQKTQPSVVAVNFFFKARFTVRQHLEFFLIPHQRVVLICTSAIKWQLYCTFVAIVQQSVSVPHSSFLCFKGTLHVHIMPSFLLLGHLVAVDCRRKKKCSAHKRKYVFCMARSLHGGCVTEERHENAKCLRAKQFAPAATQVWQDTLQVLAPPPPVKYR